MSDENNKGTITFIAALKYFGAFVFLITILGLGYAISSGFWSSAVTNLQIDLRRSQEELSNSRAELSQVKTEYSNYIANNKDQQVKSTANSDSEKVRNIPPSDKKNEVVPSYKPGKDPVTITTGQTKSFFNDALTISLIATPFGGDPLRHRVTATIGAAGHKNVTFKAEDIGYVVQYRGNELYEIRVTSADTFYASFLVSQIGGK